MKKQLKEKRVDLGSSFIIVNEEWGAWHQLASTRSLKLISPTTETKEKTVNEVRQ